MGWLKKLVGFENHFTKNFAKDIWSDPSRLLTGVDPFSTKVWNGVLGTDNKPMVNMLGSPDRQYYESAQAAGIDTGPAENFHQVADVVAGAFGAAGLSNAAGNLYNMAGQGAAGAGTGAAGAGTGVAGSGAGVAGGASAVAPAVAGTGGAAAGGTAAAGGGLLSSLGGWQGVVSAVGGIASAVDAKSQAKDQAAAIAAANERGTVPGYALPYVTDAFQRSQALANKPYEAYNGLLTPQENAFEAASYSKINDWAQGTPQSQQLNDIFGRMAGGPNQFAQTAQTAAGTSMPIATARNNEADFAKVRQRGMDVAQAQAQGMTNTNAGFTGATNRFIGQQSAGIQGVESIAGNLGSNPYLGQSAGQISGAPQVRAGTNAMMGMDNPYLRSAIDLAQGDVARNYDRSIRPAQDARMAMSGSFGNTGLMAQQTEEDRNFASELGRISTGMRMQDYGAQQQLHEADVTRRLGTDQFNAQNALGAQQFNLNARAGDLGRNLSGSFQQQGMGLDAARFDASNRLSTQQFNANMGQSDLARNAGLEAQQGQFNANAYNSNQAQNAASQNAANQWNAGQANQMAQFNVSNVNAGNQFNANAYNTGQQYNATAHNQNAQFNAGQANQNNQWNAGALNAGNQYNATSFSNNQQFNAGQMNQMAQWNGGMAANQQQQGIQGLLGMDQRGLQAGQVLGQVGQQQRAQSQQELAAQYEQWMRAQGYDRQRQDAYVGDVRQLTYGSPQQIAPPQQSPWLSGLGAAASIYSMFPQTQGQSQNLGWGAPPLQTQQFTGWGG
jgi:hypothetical protein